ncbi:MAG: alpha/beta hydrolase [Limisphaerales bacterium]
MLQTELIPAQNSNSRDLLIVLHGLGDSMEGYRWIPQAIGSANLNVLLVNAPDAYYGGFAWYEYVADRSVSAGGVERSYRLLESLLNSTAEKGFPTARTLLFGFSQGCLMSTETAVRYPSRLAGVIGVSGYVHDVQSLIKAASPVGREQRFLVTHGTDDPLIPLAASQADFEALKSAGFQIDFHIFPKVHTIIEPELPLFKNFIANRLRS